MLRGWKQAVMTVGVITAVVLSACSKQEEPKDTEPVTETKEPAELVFYTPNLNTEEYFNVTFGDSLRKKFPHFTIKFLNGQTGGSIDNMIINNTHFDLYFSTAGRPETMAFQQGFAHDMTELLKKHKVDLNQFDPAFKDALGPAYGGRTFFLPFRADSLLVFYNKDIFDRFGVPYPVNGMTWDDFYALARKITRLDNGVQYVGYQPGISGLIRSNPLSIPLVQAGTLAPTIHTDQRWSTFFQKLIVDASAAEEQNVLKTTAKWNDFVAGTAGMVVDADATLSTTAEVLGKLNYDIVSLPVFKERPGIGSQPFMYNIAITPKAKNKDAAMQALKHLVSAEHQTYLSKSGLGSVLSDPEIRKLQATDLTHAKDKNLKALSFNKWADMTYYGITAEELRPIYTKHMNKYLTEGRNDYNTLFREADEEARKKIEDIKKTIVVDGVAQ